MRPLRTRLQEARGRLGIGWETLERDYVLYGGDGTVATAAPPALAAWEGNRVFARTGSVPPRPQPEVPSIFEWQRARLTRP